MDWENPLLLLLILPALALLLWFDARSLHPMPPTRRRALLVVRSLLVVLAVAALAGPARVIPGREQAVVFVADFSRSMGGAGIERVRQEIYRLLGELPSDVTTSVLAAGADSQVLRMPGEAGGELWERAGAVDGSRTDLAQAVSLAQGLFPAGTARHIVLVSDGQENRGSLEAQARQAAVSGTRLHTVAVAGEALPDARVTALRASQARITEGATLSLTATIDSSLAGTARLRLFENGLQVDERDIRLEVGRTQEIEFTRSPSSRNTYTYRAVLEGAAGDSLPENNEALALVDVRGKALWLHVEGEPEEARHLATAMEQEGIRLLTRTPQTLPQSLRELSAFDGVILSDVPAHQLSESWMSALRDYVGRLGGGFVMVGGMNSFGVGGYYRTPVEELLPLKLKAPDQEEHQSSALALVIDRSGSMAGQKIEFAKSAALATAELLTAKDFLGVYAFDSQVQTIVPMSRVPAAGGGALAGSISLLTPGGGTDIHPGMVEARQALAGVKARLKHMIVLSDGQTAGQGYEALAAAARSEGITISTVAVGQDAAAALLQAIAAAGGGQAYQTMDASTITRIFTQDTMIHTGRLIREEAFQPKVVERHPILRGLEGFPSPPLLGYVKTHRKATAQVPLVTDLGDPLLAFWRYELGKVSAFTSDCKSRWAPAWINGWPGFSQFWAQLLRETARPPQGHQMDLRLEAAGDQTRIQVELLEDAGTFQNDAQVTAEVFFVPAHALGSSLRPVGAPVLEQSGPGLYGGSFTPAEPGVYLVRAQAGGRVVTGGHVFNPSAEAATGQVNEPLLKRAAELTGATWRAPDAPAAPLRLEAQAVARYAELRPLLLKLLLGLFLIDLLLRRWDNVRGMAELLRQWLPGRLAGSPTQASRSR